MWVKTIPDQTSRISFTFLTCNAAAVKLRAKYAATPNATIYARKEKTKDNNTPARKHKTSRDGKK
jgi:hypothetical protein